VLIKINDINNFDSGIVKKITEILINEKIAILPTSTIYGLSCIYTSKKAIKRIYEIKQRKRELPFIILFSKLDDIRLLIEKKNRTADKLIRNYWLSENTKPLTLVFKKNKTLDNFLTGQKDTIAIRLDSFPLIKKVIDICGPIISTSATLSGTGLSPKNIKEIPDEIKNKVDLIVGCSFNLDGVASTVLDITGSKPAIIREGQLKFEEIKERIGHLL
jgi:L-threonylcarbamoyladenylate synthase